jgi:DNA-directed RNA polymerase subunit E'/Rpb7
MHQVGGDMNTLLLHALSRYEGQCIKEGYLKRGSIQILHYSCGTVTGDMIEFEIVFECLLANPMIGQLLKCKVESVTKAGLKCRLDEPETPFTIFIARDHHYLNSNFTNIKENDMINAKIIGQRFEIYDTTISVLASIE